MEWIPLLDVCEWMTHEECNGKNPTYVNKENIHKWLRYTYVHRLLDRRKEILS